MKGRRARKTPRRPYGATYGSVKNARVIAQPSEGLETETPLKAPRAFENITPRAAFQCSQEKRERNHKRDEEIIHD